MTTTLGHLGDISLSKRDSVTRIDRKTIFGNHQFPITDDCSRDEACDKYEAYFYERIARDKAFKEAVLALRGHKLYCWCTPKRCHGETIINWLITH